MSDESDLGWKSVGERAKTIWKKQIVGGSIKKLASALNAEAKYPVAGSTLYQLLNGRPPGDRDGLCNALSLVFAKRLGRRREDLTQDQIEQLVYRWLNEGETENPLPAKRTIRDIGKRGTALVHVLPAPADNALQIAVTNESDLSGIDLWTPGPSIKQISAIYAPQIGADNAASIACLSQEAIDAIARGDFAKQVAISDSVLAIASDTASAQLRGEAQYLKAEGLRLLADFQRDRKRAQQLQNDALDYYEDSLSALGMDPRPIRGSARILELQGKPDEALVRFRRAFALADLGLTRVHPLTEFSIAHESARSLRHKFSCLAEIETSSLLRPSTSGARNLELERLIQESEQKHRDVLPLFRNSETWWRIEWFMAAVFHAKGWNAVGQPSVAAKRLWWALDQRLAMLPPTGTMSDVEAGNFSWWLNTAMQAVAGLEPGEREGFDRLAAEISAEASREQLHRAGQEFLRLQLPPWDRT